ncbi:GAF domain-containing protein [Blastococcus sp. MG754426]|uniref:GAF domain-containing protein n=1 Tax=unclassified Blastococcus TaxID=2619396 RepID=UPI001EF08C47|nr:MULTISPECIES: GAF domain-containing protein [unclassified Blastococcus]MCF6509667.1 GAF domain-containing protein [Blastococcus sp. MG754426]MCF6510730.1 GAF domain-containing protein [Blastococcus sp. MG754427]
MAGWSAVSPGTDLSRHAQVLVRVHDAVLAGARPPVRPRAVVARSWSRVLELGLDAARTNARAPLPFDEVERRRRVSPLALVADELRQVLGSPAEASSFLVVVTDADGVILWREGSARVRSRADALGFTEGARWTEGAVGTNAIGTALAEAAPVQLFSAEHFETAQHPWYCTAAPIHHPVSGELLGVVDVSGPALTLHPVIGALVETAVKLAESRLWRHHEHRLERVRRSARAALAATRGPVLLVDDDGWVAHRSGIEVRDRIEVPRPDRLVAVPGLGLCTPERLGEGWLVRPRGPGDPIDAELDLTAAPVLRLRTGAEGWRTPLTRRHAEVLLLLHRAGRPGLTAAALSAALFGDGEHCVTVRAEVSRLRRVVGGLVTTNPYRLADGVTLSVVPSPVRQRGDRPGGTSADGRPAGHQHLLPRGSGRATDR